ncbi:hypothetical protein GCM10023148_25880 [Actinokineospora soli]
MARPPDTAKRAELVAAALDDLATHGLAEFTLRGLATRLGTSARMLVHYFGGRDALLEAVFAEHRRRTTALITTASDAGRAAWAAMTDDAQRGHFVVMFHLLAASLTDPTDSPVAQAAIVAWVDQVTDLLQARGVDRARARTDATVLASGLKGILLDRLITADHARCDAAAARLLQLCLG